MNTVAIGNPKRNKSSKVGSAAWYEYYAGFAPDFVDAVLDLAVVPKKCLIDPWNGSGTSTTVALSKGFDVFGFDINPATV